MEYVPDVRNGVYPDGEYITGNDPRDAKVCAIALPFNWAG